MAFQVKNFLGKLAVAFLKTVKSRKALSVRSKSFIPLLKLETNREFFQYKYLELNRVLIDFLNEIPTTYSRPER